MMNNLVEEMILHRESAEGQSLRRKLPERQRKYIRERSQFKSSERGMLTAPDGSTGLTVLNRWVGMSGYGIVGIEKY